MEYFFFSDMFSRFADEGYRVCSIMGNPNNFSFFLWFCTFYGVYHEMQLWKKLLVFANSIILIRLTGSRMRFVILAAGLMIIGLQKLIHFAKTGGHIEKCCICYMPDFD